MDGIVHAAKLEGEVDQLVARDSPDLRVRVVLGALDASINGVRHGAGHLGQREPGVEHDNELAVWCTGHDRVDLNRVTVRPDDTVHVSIHLPMLVFVRQLVYFSDRQLWHAGNIGVLRERFGDGQVTGGWAVRIPQPVQKNGEVVGRRGILREDTVQDAVPASIVDLITDDGPCVGPETDETVVSLRRDVDRERGGVLHEHCKNSVRINRYRLATLYD